MDTFHSGLFRVLAVTSIKASRAVSLQSIIYKICSNSSFKLNFQVGFPTILPVVRRISAQRQLHGHKVRTGDYREPISPKRSINIRRWWNKTAEIGRNSSTHLIPIRLERIVLEITVKAPSIEYGETVSSISAWTHTLHDTYDTFICGYQTGTSSQDDVYCNDLHSTLPR